MDGETEPCGGYGVKGLTYDHSRRQCVCPYTNVLYGMRCLHIEVMQAEQGMMKGGLW